MSSNTLSNIVGPSGGSDGLDALSTADTTASMQSTTQAPEEGRHFITEGDGDIGSPIPGKSSPHTPNPTSLVLHSRSAAQDHGSGARGNLETPSTAGPGSQGASVAPAETPLTPPDSSQPGSSQLSRKRQRDDIDSPTPAHRRIRSVALAARQGPERMALAGSSNALPLSSLDHPVAGVSGPMVAAGATQSDDIQPVIALRLDHSNLAAFRSASSTPGLSSAETSALATIGSDQYVTPTSKHLSLR
jgi:hypothetical protein